MMIVATNKSKNAIAKSGDSCHSKKNTIKAKSSSCPPKSNKKLKIHIKLSPNKSTAGGDIKQKAIAPKASTPTAALTSTGTTAGPAVIATPSSPSTSATKLPSVVVTPRPTTNSAASTPVRAKTKPNAPKLPIGTGESITATTTSTHTATTSSSATSAPLVSMTAQDVATAAAAAAVAATPTIMPAVPASNPPIQQLQSTVAVPNPMIQPQQEEGSLPLLLPLQSHRSSSHHICNEQQQQDEDLFERGNTNSNRNKCWYLGGNHCVKLLTSVDGDLDPNLLSKVAVVPTAVGELALSVESLVSDDITTVGGFENDLLAKIATNTLTAKREAEQQRRQLAAGAAAAAAVAAAAAIPTITINKKNGKTNKSSIKSNIKTIKMNTKKRKGTLLGRSVAQVPAIPPAAAAAASIKVHKSKKRKIATTVASSATAAAVTATIAPSHLLPVPNPIPNIAKTSISRSPITTSYTIKTIVKNDSNDETNEQSQRTTASFSKHPSTSLKHIKYEPVPNPLAVRITPPGSPKSTSSSYATDTDGDGSIDSDTDNAMTEWMTSTINTDVVDSSATIDHHPTPTTAISTMKPNIKSTTTTKQ